ncbi:MAG: hypothetical protein EBU93_02045, partial [Chlamydiae bacterium]|nr:hypothetical protein [Chlamydiota bacterium]
NKLHHALTHHTKSIDEIQHDLGLLNGTLASLRRKSKSGLNTIDLSEAEKSICKTCDLFESLKERYPTLIEEEESLYDIEKGFTSVEIEEIEKMMDKISFLITQRQNEIPEITQNLKLITDLNEIITKIIQEIAKEHKKAPRTSIENMLRG